MCVDVHVCVWMSMCVCGCACVCVWMCMCVRVCSAFVRGSSLGCGRSVAILNAAAFQLHVWTVYSPKHLLMSISIIFNYNI